MIRRHFPCVRWVKLGGYHWIERVKNCLTGSSHPDYDTFCRKLNSIIFSPHPGRPADGGKQSQPSPSSRHSLS